MPEKNLGFVDSTLRDGQEALLGGRLRTELITPLLERLDEVGFQAIEAWGGGTFRSALALLHEDPWERLRMLKKGLKCTPIQMLLRGRFLVGDRPYSYEFVKRFLTHASELGVDVVRLLDPLNDFESLRKVAQIASRVGLSVQVSVLCSRVRNNQRNYRSLIDSDKMPDADAVGIFDPWGTLRAATVGELVRMLIKRGRKRVFVHTHNLGGSGILSAAMAREEGASLIDSCFATFAMDGSLPSIETLVRTIGADGFLTSLDLAALVEASNAFQKVRKEYFDKVPAMMRPETPIEKNIQSIRPTSSSILMQESSAEPHSAEDELRQEVVEIMDELKLAGIVAPVADVLARQALLNIHSKSRYNQLTNEFLALLRGTFGPVRPSSELKDIVRIDVNRQTEGLREEVNDQVFTPTSVGKLRESDFLSFAIFPQEFSEMSHVRDGDALNQKERILAATLAILAEEGPAKLSNGKPAAEPRALVNAARWKYPSRLEDLHAVPKRGFIEEPF